MVQFYAAGMSHATDPFDVGKVINEAITTETPKLRYTVSWGAEEIISGRARMSDAEWVAMGGHADAADDAYYDAFDGHFGIDLRQL